MEYSPDDLDRKLATAFDGKVVRKDLLHRIKKGTNVPTFVLEFLLARYCASDDPAEIQAGMEAVLDTLNENYVRPNDANAAQSRVATKGKHRFIDKVHVNYVEKDRRHWAALENFDSRRVAIGEKYYRDNDRLLQGGLWAEVTVAFNEVEDDKYTFYVEDLRPIQLSRFDFDRYCEGRAGFTRDEWMDVILRSVGLEPSKLSARVKFHYIARLAPLIEANYNFIELGPRGTGKSYFFSEFSPYSTLISGGQATKAVLFYNSQRHKIGLVGFWDTVAFDEVGGLKVKDPDTIQIMKDFMANGRFSRGVEVIADASMAFVGNLDLSVDQIVHSEVYDLFQPLPKEFDLAVQDRFACYLPGWEMPKNSSEFLTSRYGFITDYLAEAFHHQLKQTNRYEEVSKRIKLGREVEGRDEKGVKKTVCAFLKILHPNGSPTDAEFEEYVAYAVEGRRRVKEQMNKRKTDDEYARINLSYISATGQEVVVFCPESRNATATLEPSRRSIHGGAPVPSLVPAEPTAPAPSPAAPPAVATVVEPESTLLASATPQEIAMPAEPELTEQHFTIHYGDTGHSYESIVLPYLRGARSVTIEDPYIRATHQVQNFVRFCEAVIKAPSVRNIMLITSYDDTTNLQDLTSRLDELKQSLLELDVALDVKVNENLHDREIRIDNGWTIKIGRGLDFFQKPDSWFGVGANDISLRRCLETKVDIFKAPAA
ncbi:BREX system Lon protease-like protein BrxL [Paraburkholderia sp. MMS20-SJTN17]|uniref:BREX system Lon protease-like protein BrxL n=1 Tax=Paraburkholderia translucens TaxID=2886945 RepID=A0ABS8KAV3_9BURK|nr:BREX system Lon protease-like protein BrxL [Paraburkholderia sp. MMS20-SJTN17]MCC8401860.1 BREX system Lon protease-like protein BrxL [Paraburkholderia sp. MMS20-SJTN17]